MPYFIEEALPMNIGHKFKTFPNLIWKDKNIPDRIHKTWSLPILLDRCTYIGKRAEKLMAIVPMPHTGGTRPKEMQDQLLFSKQHFSFCNFFLFPYNCVYFY